MRNRTTILLLVCLSLLSCSPRALREAKSVVAEADSLWHAGQTYSDSLRLSEAYRTLDKWQWIYPDEFAHSGYHYGRLLRTKDNPVEAMQCFIAASHSHTRDYHILGRVYSNMGSICHLASECPLAYDMYERSANYFLKNSDTLLYYYGLNNMAFELAEQGMKQETFSIIDSLTCDCDDATLHALTHLAKARLFNNLQQYDSVLCYLSMCHAEYTSMDVLKAQAFEHLGYKDSALYYADKVLVSLDASDCDKYNMLYIVMNYDSTLSSESVISLSAQRSDLETEILTPQHNQWAMAVQLLEQDINKRPDLRWLYAIMATLFIIGCGLAIYVRRKYQQRQLLSQQIDNLQHETSAIQEKHDELTELYFTNQKRIEEDINHKCAVLRANDKLTKDLSWNDFEAMCKIIDRQFYLIATKLYNQHVLNETEIRLCILVLLDMNRAEISHTLPYAINSVGKLKDHTAKLLGTSGKNLRVFLLKMAIEGASF